MATEIRKTYCGLCLAEGKKSEAIHFCKDCDSNICESCKDSHSKFRDLRRHTVVSNNMMPPKTTDISTQLGHLSTKPSEESTSTETINLSGKPEDALEVNDISSSPTEASVQAATAPSSKDGSSTHTTNGLLDLEVMLSTKVNIKQSGERYKRDRGTPYISSCCFMPGGELVLSDDANVKIKVLDRALVFKDSLELLNIPGDVAAYDTSNIVVTLRNAKQVQLIRVLPSLKKERAITVGHQCTGVYVVGGRIYVLCSTGYKKSEVRVYSADRKLCRKIDTSRYEFHFPYRIAVNEKQKLFFITDLRTLTCLASDGTMRYQYGNEGGRKKFEPSCLYLDEKDNVVVCDEETNEVQLIMSSGKKYKTLLAHKEEKMQLRCVAYRPSDGKLAIGGTATNHLFVYKPKDILH